MHRDNWKHVFENQDKILKQLKPLENELFLAGGTGLQRFALPQAYRHSEDLDFFFTSLKNKEEIDKLDYLINDETELLLNLLSSYKIENYACEQFDLISKKWEGDLVDALHYLDYDFSEKISLEDHIEIVEDHGYQVLETKDSYKDIVSQAMAHQWMELFEEMTMQQRDLYINQIRGEYER